ncbi:MAG: TolC family outer membrane protein [Methylotetracoccus sp.]
MKPARALMATPRTILALAGLILCSGRSQGMDLLKVYELALERDPTYRAAEATRNAILETKPQSIAQLLPTIAFTGSLNRNSLKVKSTPIILQRNQNVGFWTSDMNVQLTQPIYRHELWVQLSQADNQIAAAEAQFAAEEQNVTLRAARAYFDVLLAEANLSFAEAEKLATERQFEQAKARFDVGLIAITDVKVAESAYDAVIARVIAADNEWENSKEALKQIIGEYDDDLARLRGTIPFDRPNPDDIEKWHELGQQNSLLITVATNQAELAKKGIDLQFAGHLPTLDMVGAVDFADTNRPNGINTESQWIGAQLNIPIFSGGGVNARVDQARFQFEAANEQLDVQRRAVKLQVKNSFRGVISAIGQVKALRTAIASTRTALEAEQAGFEVGTRTMVDVVVVLRNLYANKRDFARAVYDYIVNSLTLKQSASLLGREDVEIVNRWLTNARAADPLADVPDEDRPMNDAPPPP